MKIIIFGSSGMVGQSTLREALLDKNVTEVLAVGRTSLPNQSPKLKQLVANDLFNLEAHSSQLTGIDVCFFSLGATAAGLSEEQYARINFELPMSVARLLVKLNPAMTFIYVSGTGTDSSEKGSVMWARVKGKTENQLKALPFKSTYMFRLAGLLPVNGERSKTPLYQFFYTLCRPFFSVLAKLFPNYVVTSVEFGQAVLQAAREAQGHNIIESADIKRRGQSGAVCKKVPGGG